MSRLRAGLSRNGITLVEVVIVACLIAVLAAISLPAVQSAREKARQASCGNNLRQLGIALTQYESACGSFPCGATVGSAQSLVQLLATGPRDVAFHATAFAMLLPYVDQDPLYRRYDFRRKWDKQRDNVVNQVVPLYVCPSTSHDNPYVMLQAPLAFDVGNSFGITDYILCKGVFDGWCLFPRSVRKDERGMFDGSFLNGGKTSFACKYSDLLDGASTTIALGEGACGARWPLCGGQGCTKPVSGSEAMNAWAAQPSFRGVFEAGLLLSSIFGASIDPINKNPVTQTVVWAKPGEVEELRLCNSSVDWKGDGRTAGKHQTSGFRSDHVAGAQFSFADGSVRFISERIDLATFRAISTIAGGEDLPVVD